MRRRAVSWRELQRRCDELLDGMAVPQPFDLEGFAREVGRRRGRPIRLVDLPERKDGANAPTWNACGLVAQLDREDVIFVERADWVHRVHVGLHEIAHLVCGHPGTSVVGVAMGLLPDLDEEMVRAVLGRTRYSEAHEQEAEAVASLLSARLLSPGAGRGHGVPTGDEVMARVERTLGGPARC